MAGVLSRLFGRTGALSDGLESGRMARRMAGWVPSRVHVNTLIASSGQTTLARARYLVRNNGYALNAVECFSSNVVGTGIVPSWLPPQPQGSNSAASGDLSLKEQGQQLWFDWTDEADAEGLTDLYGLMRRAAREVFIAGECFIRKRPRYLSDGLSVPLQIQLLPSEMLDASFTQDLDNGNRIRQGIEFNRIGRRVAYHFWTVHPGDSTERSLASLRTRVLAADVLHILDPIEGGQIRGLSRLTPAIVPLWVLDAYDDAELERKKTAALFSIFIKRIDPTPTFIDKVKEDAAKSATGDGIATVNLQPGTAHQLLPGEEVQVANPADVGNSYEQFQYRTLARICAALGLPYAGVTGDLTAANYANQRAALIEARRRLQALQYGVLVFLMCRPIWNWFLEAAVLADALILPGYADNRRPYQKVRWIAPRWEWVDPLKDRQAEVVALNARTKSISQAIEEEGNDPDEVFKQIAKDQTRMRELGIAPPVAESEAPLPNGGVVDKTPAKPNALNGANGASHGRATASQDENVLLDGLNGLTSALLAAPAPVINVPVQVVMPEPRATKTSVRHDADGRVTETVTRPA